MAPHSSTLAWKIPWTEEPGRLQSMGSLGVGHDWATSLPFSLSCIGEGNGNPLQCSCLESPRDGGTWWAAIYGVAQSRTRLKRLSSSSSRKINDLSKSNGANNKSNQQGQGKMVRNWWNKIWDYFTVYTIDRGEIENLCFYPFWKFGTLNPHTVESIKLISGSNDKLNWRQL